MFTNDTKPTATETPTVQGSPIGLLLLFTHAMSMGFTRDTKPSGSYTNDLKP